MHICAVNKNKPKQPKYLLNMKKITFILFALIAGTTFAQTNNATATVNAEIVAPISIAQDNISLDFGKIALTGADMWVNVDNTGVRTFQDGNAQIGLNAMTFPTFTVTNPGNNTYTISKAVVSEPGAGLTLSNIDTGLTGAQESNMSTVKIFGVGARLNITDATAVVGANNAGTIKITVNYN